MPHLTCAQCQRKMDVAQAGAAVVVMFDNPPRPYQLWQADILACPRCHVEIVAGYGVRPVSEHWQPEFAQRLQQAQDAPGARVIYEYERARPATAKQETARQLTRQLAAAVDLAAKQAEKIKRLQAELTRLRARLARLESEHDASES